LMWTGVVIVTHGLKWWQQAILVFLAGALFLWATIATHLMRKGSTRKDVFVQGSSQPLTEVPSLRERIFTVCNEMSVYMGERQSRPDEVELYAQFKDSSTLYAAEEDQVVAKLDLGKEEPVLTDLLRCGQKSLTAFTPFFTSQERRQARSASCCNRSGVGASQEGVLALPKGDALLLHAQS
jgi:hypothetical protein